MRDVPEHVDFSAIVLNGKFVGVRLHLSMSMRTVIRERGTKRQMVDMEMCWTVAVYSRSENSKRWKHEITLVADEDEGPEKLLRDIAALYEHGDMAISRKAAHQ